MKKITLLAVGLLVFSGCGDSTKPVADRDTGGGIAEATGNDEVAESVTAITGEYDKAMGEFREWYSSASDEEKQTGFEDKYPKAVSYAKKLMAIAEQNVGSDGAVDALVWVTTKARGSDVGKQARATLLEKYRDNEAIGAILPMMAYESSEEVEKQLREFVANAPGERVKGISTLALATFLQRMASTQESAKDPQMAQYFKDDIGYIEAFKPNAEEVEKLYETVVAKYGQITRERGGTLGESAQAALFEMRNLQVGMPAPDIESADLDGVNFKLSDYRGKVVLLDFWGNW